MFSSRNNLSISFILQLPLNKDILLTIFYMLSLQDASRFAIATNKETYYSLFKPKLDEQRNYALTELWQSVVDEDDKAIKILLNKNPLLLLAAPSKALKIESKRTWQIFHIDIHDRPLSFSLKRRQYDQVQSLYSYFAELEKRNYVQSGNEEALKQWQLRELCEEEKNSYIKKFEHLIEKLAKETFPNGTRQDRIIDRISSETSKLLSDFRKELVHGFPILLDQYYDLEQLLLASYYAFWEARLTFLENKDVLDLYCISVIGFIQSIITPELRNEFENGIGSNQINNLKASIFYRSARDATEGLGFDNLLGIKHGKRFPPLPRIECDVSTIELLEDHIKNKQSKLIDQGKKLYENKVTIQLGNNVRS